MKNFKDKVAVITGAASGIGKHLAIQLAEQGAFTVLADVNAEGLEQTATYITDRGGQASIHLVDVADREFRIPGKAQTDSRLTLLTGIHRRYVKTLREEIRREFTIPPNASIGGQLIGVWLSDERFLDSDDHPLPLPKSGDEHTLSFEDLVRTVTTDLRPRAILDELDEIIDVIGQAEANDGINR